MWLVLAVVSAPVSEMAPVAGSKISALARAAYCAPQPPTSRTEPFGSKVAVCACLAETSEAEVAKVLVCTSKISVVATFVEPPARKTRPSASSVAVCQQRDVMVAVAVNVPVSASYNSARSNDAVLVQGPPANRTLPLVSRVAVWQLRARTVVPVAVKIRATGS